MKLAATTDDSAAINMTVTGWGQSGYMLLEEIPQRVSDIVNLFMARGRNHET